MIKAKNEEYGNRHRIGGDNRLEQRRDQSHLRDPVHHQVRGREVFRLDRKTQRVSEDEIRDKVLRIAPRTIA